MAEHELQSMVRAGVPRARARFLTQSMQLEEQELPGIQSIGILLTTLLLVGGIIWAHITPISEVAHSSGEVIPAGRINQVQHLEGGIVTAIHVNNGDLVNKDDVLLELSTNSTKSELTQIEKRKIGLEARLKRINFLLGDYEHSSNTKLIELSVFQKKLFDEQKQNYSEQIALIEAQKRQRQREVSSKSLQVKALEEEVKIIKEKRLIHESVKDLNVIPKVDILDSNARLARAVSQLREVQSQIQVARESINESEQKKVEFISRWRQELRLESEQVANELSEVEEELNRINLRLARLEIVSPVTGIVQALQVNTLNAVVEPGQVILELVPIDEELVVETRILPKDIGHIQEGQRVDVKVSSFESQRFGSIGGSLRKVSATTYLDIEQNPYYKAEILLAKNFVGNNSEMNKLVPGMIVEADIHTGEKTILEYILKPVYRGFDGAMQER